MQTLVCSPPEGSVLARAVSKRETLGMAPTGSCSFARPSIHGAASRGRRPLLFSQSRRAKVETRGKPGPGARWKWRELRMGWHAGGEEGAPWKRGKEHVVAASHRDSRPTLPRRGLQRQTHSAFGWFQGGHRAAGSPSPTSLSKRSAQENQETPRASNPPK
jgi:hypothetical protein